MKEKHMMRKLMIQKEFLACMKKKKLCEQQKIDEIY